MDRSTVWAEIDSILESIDPNRASWISLLDPESLDGPNPAAVLDFLVSLEDWAALNRLEDIIPAMLSHGFDCASFINGVIDEPGLQQMGVKCPSVRRHVLAAVNDLPRGVETVAASLTPAATVETFLQRLCMQQHLVSDFADLRHCPIDSLAGVTDSELREKYHIRKLGHRQRIVRCLGRLPPLLLHRPACQQPLQQQPQQQQQQQQQKQQQQQQQKQQQQQQQQKQQQQPPPLPTKTRLATAAASGPSSNSSSSASGSNSNCSSSNSSSGNFSDRHLQLSSSASGEEEKLTTSGKAPNSATSASKSAAANSGEELPLPDKSSSSRVSLRRCRSLQVESQAAPAESQRPPAGAEHKHQAASSFSPKMRSGWPHHPQVLLGGSVSYAVSYLGFRPLENHTDQSEVARVMRTIRCKSADILKLPQIHFTVCYKGVKFVNPDNEMVITEHSITDIYFACQDNASRANFAYVTKDTAGGTHCCHCFAAHSQDAAVLIINTLSEACSLADELIEHNQQCATETTRAGTTG